MYVCVCVRGLLILMNGGALDDSWERGSMLFCLCVCNKTVLHVLVVYFHFTVCVFSVCPVLGQCYILSNLPLAWILLYVATACRL